MIFLNGPLISKWARKTDLDTSMECRFIWVIEGHLERLMVCPGAVSTQGELFCFSQGALQGLQWWHGAGLTTGWSCKSSLIFPLKVATLNTRIYTFLLCISCSLWLYFSDGNSESCPMAVSIMWTTIPRPPPGNVLFLQGKAWANKPWDSRAGTKSHPVTSPPLTAVASSLFPLLSSTFSLFYSTVFPFYILSPLLSCIILAMTSGSGL